ncbi:MAG: 4-hydroxy-3-methylbut-2-enyl diphosphate reductase [Alphaproteobacteria bacterium]|nr:4-hydroxy-3-methylbut-2-enyl diphosphate reductase [Alphaproteobacteria bacterium]
MICYLLSPRGYCVGVKRAVDMVNQIIKLYGSVYMIEDIIHNKLFVNNLLKSGVKKVNSIDEVPDGAAVMFSAHGVSPDLTSKAEERDITVIDSTCPIVKELQTKVQEKSEEGYSIIIIGNRAHQEVVALLGYVKNDNVYVVNSEMDIDLLPNLVNKKVMYFTQTSMYPGDIKPIINALKAKMPNIEASNSFIQEPFTIAHNICQETLDRQESIRLVADKIDLLLVIGSEESSNALSLVSAGKDNGIQKVVRIDSKEELTDDIFDGVNNMAIASAASVDIEIFNNIVEYIKGKNIFIVEEFNQECNNNFSDKSQNLRDTENNINIINETTPLTTQSPSNSL